MFKASLPLNVQSAHAESTLLLGDADEAIKAIVLAVEANAGTSLKPPSFWQHFHTVVITLLQALMAPSAAPAEQQGAASGAPSAQNGAAANDTQRSTQEELMKVISARAPRRQSTTDSEANGQQGGTGSGRGAEPNGSADDAVVPTLVAESAAAAPAKTANGAANTALGGGELRGDLQAQTLLDVARFWLNVALRSARFPTGPAALHPHPEEKWTVPLQTPVMMTGMIMLRAVRGLEQLLQLHDGALLLSILALPEFRATMCELLFHAQGWARQHVGGLLSKFVLPGPPEAQHKALHVRSGCLAALAVLLLVPHGDVSTSFAVNNAPENSQHRCLLSAANAC